MFKRLSVLMIVILLLVGCSSSKSDEVVRIGGKNFTEQYIMANMLSILIEDQTEYKTDITVNLSGTVLFDALKADEFDLYLEYTGTALTNLGHEPMFDSDEVYELVKKEFDEKLDIAWMEPYGFNNTYAMITTQEIADQYNLQTLSDMAKVGSELRLAATYLFTERDDGYPGLSEHYDFEFKKVTGMEPALMYQALDAKSVDVISGFATDGLISVLDLVVLEDDLSFFPPYDASVIVRNDSLERFDGLEDVLNLLAGRLSDAKMSELNGLVDESGLEPEDVARDFLIEEGLIDG